MTRLFPGDRRVWLVAVAAAITFGGVLLYEVLIPRDYFTGTNNVRSRSVVVELRDGQRLCIPGLDIPDGTGRVELDLPGGHRRPALELSLRAGEQRVRADRPAELAPSDRKAAIAIRPLDLPAKSVSGSFCVRLRGPGKAVVGGMLELQPGERGPTVDGRPLGARVSVWFRPPVGDKRSIAGLFPDIARRAALFRPGVIQPWTYWFLLLVAAPAIAYLAVRTLARASSGDFSPAQAARRVGLAALLSAVCWSLITPAFDAPDETDHFAYGQYLAETGNAPCQACARPQHSTEESVALESLRLHSRIEARDGRPPWLALDEARWVARAGGVARDDGGGTTTAATHAPVYYSLLLPSYAAASSQSIFARLHMMRLLSALLGAITAMAVFLTVRELLPSRDLVATAAGLLVAFQPMFGFISGAVNNDAGVNCAAAVAILVIVRVVRRGWTLGLAAALGALLVLLPLMKVTGYAVYPAAIAAAGATAWRHRHRLSAAPWLVLVLTFAVLQIAWNVVSPEFDRTAFATPGGGVPGTQGPVADALGNLTGFASYLWQIFLPQLPFMADLHPQSWPAYDIYVQRGFAAFGWYAYTFPKRVYALIVGVMFAVAVLAIMTLWRERDALRRIWVELALLLLVIIAVIGGVEASYFSGTGGRHAVAEQGRYAFTALVPLSVVVVGACFAFRRRYVVWMASSLTIGMIGLNYASQWMFISTAYS